MRVTAETKTATRQRILEVARQQFARQGFEKATTRDIARAAGIAVGTLFNYFPTKESIVESLVSEAYAEAAGPTPNDGVPRTAGPQSLEEELFAHVATTLRKLRPYRKFLTAVLETSLSPLASDRAGAHPPPRVAHLEAVGRVVSRHGRPEALTALAAQLYWTLYTGVLAFWAEDPSPHQEDTLALLDQSLAMFVGWLTGRRDEEGTARPGG